MQNLETRATKRYNERRRSTARRYGIGLLALLVLLCTAVALLLPAFTLEKDVFCGLEEHTHTEACYELVPVCAVEEHAAHTHTDACFETVRELSCGLEESEGHTHTDACFAVEKELTCGIAEDAGHTHTEACYIEEREPVCGIVEDAGHIHDESCWVTERELVCALEENEEHQHDDACYIENPLLVCGEEQREGHVHDDSCYETYRVPNCGEEEREGHTHTDECYTEKQKLVCELPEDEGHTHSDACYAEKQKLVCELPEDEGHTHSEACFEKKLICEKEEHTHSLQCYSNPEAVESEAEWLLSFPAFTEDTPRLERLLGIAVSQIGYQESAANYLVDENESLHGYTRFGDFCGEPYADWNAMFVSFCLHYADIDAAFFPAEGDAQGMIDALTEKELYIPNGTEGFLPRPGDLVFFDNLYTGTYDVRVGIVTSVDAESGVLTVIEGDIADRVNESKYAPDDTTILGYGALPETLHEEAAAEADTTAESTDTKAADTKAAETKADETKADETKADETKDAETKDAETKDADTEKLQAKGLLRLPGQANLLGVGESAALEDIAAITLVNSDKFNGVDRNADIELQFNYSIKQEKLTDAQNAGTWVYDLTNYAGNDKILALLDGQAGNLYASDGKTKTGTYTVEGSKIIITPRKDYQAGMDELHGSFTINAKLNANNTGTGNSDTIEFPGIGDITFTYKEKSMEHKKTVGPSASENAGTGSDVQVVKEDGKFYLYYRIHVKPNGKGSLARLILTDTISEGQTLDKSSFAFSGPGVTFDNTAIQNSGSLSGVTDQGFKLDVVDLLKNNGGVQDWQDYYVTYRTEVPEESLDQNLKNTVVYHWDGEDITEEVPVTPKFEEELKTDKFVGLSENGANQTSGNVAVEKDENGKYWLYYRLTAKPNTDVSSLTLNDTLGVGQTIDTSSLKLTVDGVEKDHNALTVNATDGTISGTIAYDFPANKEVVLTYRAELSAEAVADKTEMENTAKWDWEYDKKPDPDTTEVTPDEPDPIFPVKKEADLAAAKPGDTITYTIVIGDGEMDLSGWTFTDKIAYYPFTVTTPTVTYKGTGTAPAAAPTVSAVSNPPTNANIGDMYDLFTVAFPSGTECRGPYEITYTITLSNDPSVVGQMTGKGRLINRGIIGRGQDGTNTEITYGEPPKATKTWTSFNEEDNTVTWTVTVTVPAERSFEKVTLREHDFLGSTDGNWYHEQMTMLWDELAVADTEGNRLTRSADYTVDETKGTITFNSLSKSLVLTLKTRLPDGIAFSDPNLNAYWVENGLELLVNDKHESDAIVPKKYEKADYSFTKTGKFDQNNPYKADWKVTINGDGHELDPDVIPYFIDRIPEGMQLVGDVQIALQNNTNHTNKVSGRVVGYSTTINRDGAKDGVIGRIDLVDAFAFLGDYAPEGLSGLTYVITYSTELTDEKKQQVLSNVKVYTFTNEAKIVDGDGDTLKTTSDTVTYKYDDLVSKTDISQGDSTGKVAEIKYKIVVNENGRQINGGQPVTLYDTLKTDVTLLTDSVVIKKVTVSDESGAKVYTEGDTVYSTASDSAIMNDSNIIVGYEDNTRQLEIVLPDQQAYVVYFNVKPNEIGNHQYENTVVLRTGTVYTEDGTDQWHIAASSGQLTGTGSVIRLKKLDQYDMACALQDAQFELHKLKLDPDGSIIEDETIETVKTGTDGVATFTNANSESTLYYWKEIASPAGYLLTDNTPHYFVIYHVYGKEQNLQRTFNLKQIRDGCPAYGDDDDVQGNSELAEKVKAELLEKHTDRGEEIPDTEYFPISDITANLDALTEFLTSWHERQAKNLDHLAQEANDITVATIDENYLWPWRNVRATANATLGGTKTLIGKNLEKDEFIFELYDISNPEKEVWLQTVKNDAPEGSDKRAASFTFNKLTYQSPGTYRYRIKENQGSRPESGIVYDDSADKDVPGKRPMTTYEVEVIVKPEDIGKGDVPIPSEQISYYKNGELVNGGAQFFNQVDQTSLTITKTFSGPLVEQKDKRIERVKDSIVFLIYKGEDTVPLKTVSYANMTAGRITLTAKDGIQPNVTYTVKEVNADINGTVRTTTYTVKNGIRDQNKSGDPSVEVTVGDKAAQVDFDNSYETEHMKLTVYKRWYVQEGENMTPAAQGPDGVSRIYFALQRYDDAEHQWNWVKKTNYSAGELVAEGSVPEQYVFTVNTAAGETTVGEDGKMPVGRYRVVELEKDGENWKVVGESAVYKDQKLEIGKSTSIDRTYDGTVEGSTGEDSSVYIYNRMEKPGITVTKNWQVDGEAEQTVYVRMIAYNNDGNYKVINDANILPDGNPGARLENGLYKIEWVPDESPEGGHWVPLTFSHIFNRDGTGNLSYQYMSVDYIKFIECKEDGTEFSDGTHVVSYSFTRAGESKPTTVESGVSPLDNGTYTVTNQKREPTKLTVTKKWKDRPEDDKDVYVRLFLIGEKSGEHAIIYPKDFQGEAPQKLEMVVPEENELKEYWANESYSTILHLQYDKDKPGDWNQVTILIPAGYKVDEIDDNYVAGVYAVELDEADNGSAQPLAREGLRIAYSYTGKDGNVVTGVSKDNPAPAGEGTLTVKNGPTIPIKDITVTKAWKNAADADAAWPSSVSEVEVQLWRMVEGGEPERVGGPVSISGKTQPHTYTWESKEVYDSDSNPYIYYVEETRVKVATDSGSSYVSAEEYFKGTSAWTGMAVETGSENWPEHLTVEATGPAEDDDVSAELVNTAPEEETTELSFTKAWYNKDGSQRTAAEGETINVKLWSKTASETTPTRVTGLETFTPENLTNLTVDAVKDELVLAFTGGVWPTGKVSGLPRYRNGELVEYYVEETGTSAVDEYDNALFYGVTYQKGGGAELSDPKDLGTGSDTITVINRIKDRSLKVEKKWADSRSHLDDTVKLTLYSWTDEPGTVVTPPVKTDHADGGSAGGSSGTTTINTEVRTDGVTGNWGVNIGPLNNDWNVSQQLQASNNSAEKTKVFSRNDTNGYTCPIKFNDYDWNIMENVSIYLNLNYQRTIGNNETYNLTIPEGGGTYLVTAIFTAPGATPPDKIPASSVFPRGEPSGTITLDDIPANATQVTQTTDIPNPITLNTPEYPGWSYTWENLPDIVGGEKIHYAVVETEAKVKAYDLEVQYDYEKVGEEISGVTITNRGDYPESTGFDLLIKKVAKGTTTPLDGALFELYKSDETKYREEPYTTGTDGTFRVDGMPAGRYRLHESRAPDGYVSSGGDIWFTVGPDGITLSHEYTHASYDAGIMTVENDFGAELPSTGGMGVEAYRIGGAALLLAATGLAAAEPLKRSRADRARRRKGGEGET